MAYQTQSFQPLSFDEANPFLTGFNKEVSAVQDQQTKQLAKSLQENKLKLGPLADTSLTGPAGQAASMEMLRKVYGEQSPQYQMAKQNFDLSQQSQQSRIGYQDALTQSMPERYLTPTGKSIVEGSNVRQGNQPSGQPWPENNPKDTSGTSAPGSPDDLGGVYQLLQQKGTTDVDTRKRNLFATNIEKTLSNLNPQDLLQYSGIPGIYEKGIDQGKSLFGSSSDKYKNYQKALEASKLLSSQVRQFYGESIQPAMINRLEELTNPSTWQYDSDVALSKFNQFKNIMSQEIKTYRDALKSSDVYQGKQDNNSINTSTSNAGINSLSNGLQLPKFNSKQEFQTWFKNQSPMVQKAVQKSMGG